MSLRNANIRLNRMIAEPPLQSRWFLMDQDRINTFADATEDQQFIHVDPALAAQTPFGGTIAHGLLTLSMTSAMLNDALPEFEGVTQIINYGYDKIRFTAPVPSGSRIRGVFALKTIDVDKGFLTLHMDVTIEIAGSPRPALFAMWIGRMYFAN